MRARLHSDLPRCGRTQAPHARSGLCALCGLRRTADVRACCQRECRVRLTGQGLVAACEAWGSSKARLLWAAVIRYRCARRMASTFAPLGAGYLPVWDGGRRSAGVRLLLVLRNGATDGGSPQLGKTATWHPASVRRAARLTHVRPTQPTAATHTPSYRSLRGQHYAPEVSCHVRQRLDLEPALRTERCVCPCVACVSLACVSLVPTSRLLLTTSPPRVAIRLELLLRAARLRPARVVLVSVAARVERQVRAACACALSVSQHHTLCLLTPRLHPPPTLPRVAQQATDQRACSGAGFWTDTVSRPGR